MWADEERRAQLHHFLAARAGRVSRAGLSLVFTSTLLAAWGASATLLAVGLINMPLRYAIAFVVGYAVLFGCVRIWADFQRTRSSDSIDAEDAVNLLDAGASVDAEGCFIVALLGVAVFAGVAAVTAFGMSGIVSIMLEAAFEVVFAGTVVRSARGYRTVGDWYGVLWRRTALPAGLLCLGLVGFAAWVQHQYPAVASIGQWLKTLL